MDGFYTGNPEGDGSDEFALGYYLKEDLGFIPHAADAFTLYDRWFCSIMASTYPNRHYQLAAQNGGQKSNSPADRRRARRRASTGRRSSTGRSRAGSASPTTSPTCRSPALYGAARARLGAPVAQFYTDAAAGTLPQRSASSTRRSATAAAATGSPPTSTRTATSASARRSCPTSPTRSSSRRSTGAGRCSSTTTSGAGSSTTSSRAASPTTARNRKDLDEDWSADRLPDPGGRDLALRARGGSGSAT